MDDDSTDEGIPVPPLFQDSACLQTFEPSLRRSTNMHDPESGSCFRSTVEEKENERHAKLERGTGGYG